MRVSVRSEAGPIAVEGVEGSDGPKILAGGQSEIVEGEDLSIREATTEEVTQPTPTDDVWDPSNRPNGPMTAGIAPKMPKSGGETMQVVDEGLKAVVERPVAELGRATQQGGPDAEPGLKTPGPQPENTVTGTAPEIGAQASPAIGSKDAERSGTLASQRASGRPAAAGAKGSKAQKSASRGGAKGRR
jgi:hypothetical protein